MTSNKSYNLVQTAIGFLQLSGGKPHLHRCLGYVGAQLAQLLGDQANLLAEPVYEVVGVRCGHYLAWAKIVTPRSRRRQWTIGFRLSRAQWGKLILPVLRPFLFPAKERPFDCTLYTARDGPHLE